jgi:hypothetical protein
MCPHMISVMSVPISSYVLIVIGGLCLQLDDAGNGLSEAVRSICTQRLATFSSHGVNGGNEAHVKVRQIGAMKFT